MELVLDASSVTTLVGLAIRGQLIWTGSAIAPQEHTLRLVPEIARGIDESHSAPGDLELVTVAVGPGAFNALRVAVSVAKGIAMGTGAAVVGVETLLAETLRCRPTTGCVRPVLRASRTGFATAAFAWRNGRWEKTSEERFVDEATLATLVDADTPLCGNDAAGACARLREAFGLEVRCATPESPSRLAVLAAEGWTQYRAGNTIPAATLQPFYARPPHITVPRDRRQ